MDVATIVELWLVCCVGAGFAVFYAWRHRAVEGTVAGFLALAVAFCGGILAAVWLAGLVQATFLSLAIAGSGLWALIGIGLLLGWLLTR